MANRTDQFPDSPYSMLRQRFHPDGSLRVPFVQFFRESNSVTLIVFFLIATTTLLAIIRKRTRRATMDVPLVSAEGTYDFASLLVKGYRAVSI